MDLQTKFPIMFSKCEEYNKKNKKNKPNIIICNGVTYDKTAIPFLTNNDINLFIDLQIKYPEIIDNCFNCLINILEEREKEEQEQKIQTPHHNHIKNIYNLLIKLNVHNNNMGMIDNWVLFIKSQNDFSKFF